MCNAYLSSLCLATYIGSNVSKHLQFPGLSRLSAMLFSSFLIYISSAPFILWLCNQFRYLAADSQRHHAIQVNTENPYYSFLCVTIFNEANSSLASFNYGLKNNSNLLLPSLKRMFFKISNLWPAKIFLKEVSFCSDYVVVSGNLGFHICLRPVLFPKPHMEQFSFVLMHFLSQLHSCINQLPLTG